MRKRRGRRWSTAVIGAVVVVPGLVGCARSCNDSLALNSSTLIVTAGVGSPGRLVEFCVDEEQCVSQPLGSDGTAEVIASDRMIGDIPRSDLGVADLDPRSVTVRIDGVEASPWSGTFVPTLNENPGGSCSSAGELRLRLESGGLIQTDHT